MLHHFSGENPSRRKRRENESFLIHKRFLSIGERIVILKNHLVLPSELEKTRHAASKALGVIKPADSNTLSDPNFLFTAQRTNAGRDLPPYYLVYFLLVELLNFKDLVKS